MAQAITKTVIRDRLKSIAENYDGELILHQTFGGGSPCAYQVREIIENGGERGISPYLDNREMYAYLQGVQHSDRFNSSESRNV